MGGAGESGAAQSEVGESGAGESGRGGKLGRGGGATRRTAAMALTDVRIHPMRRRNTNIAATLGRGANGWVQRQVGYEHGALGCPVLYGGSSGGISGGSVASAGAVAASLPASLDAGHRDLHRHRATRHADTPFHSAPTDQKRGDRYQNLDTLLYHLPPVFLKRPLKTHQDCVCVGRRTEHQVVRFVRAGERVGGQARWRRSPPRGHRT